MCIYLCIWGGYVHMHTGTHRSQKATDPLELELQATVNHLMCVLGIELRSSTRARSGC